MELSQIAEYGVLGVALMAIVGLVEVIKRKYRESESGDRRCNSESFPEIMQQICEQSKTQTRILTDMIPVLQHTSDGVERLVDQHKPGSDGREQWKISNRSEKVQEEIRDGIRDLVRMAKQNGNSK